MFSRKPKPLLKRSEAAYLWAHWWSSAGNVPVDLSGAASNDELLERLTTGMTLNVMVDEFYDAITWLETLYAK